MAGITERLQFIIGASSDGAVKGLKATADAARATGKAVDATGKDLTALERKAAAAQNTLKSGLGITALQSKLTSLGPTGARVAGGLDSIVGGLSRIGPAGLAAGAAGAAGIAILAKATLSGVAHLEQIADEARAFKGATGASAEEASRFAGAMRILGVSVQSGVAGLTILAKTVERTPSKLTALGVSIATNSKGFVDLEGTLFNVADRYKAMVAAGNTSGARNLAATALGRGFREFLPLLARGKAGVQEFYAEVDQHHEVLSQKDIDNARDLQIAGRELSQAWQGVEVELAKGVVPTLITLTDWLKTAVEWADKAGHAVAAIQAKVQHGTKNKAGKIEAGAAIGATLGTIIPGAGTVVGGLVGAGLGGALSMLDTKSHAAATSAHSHAAAEIDRKNAMAQAEAMTKKEASALSGAKSVIEGVIAADKAVASAESGVDAAVRGVSKAQRNLNDVIARGADVLHNIAQAEHTLEGSAQGLADANDRLAEARQKVNDVYADLPGDQKTADRKKREADLAVAQAQKSVQDAQKNLDDLSKPKAPTAGQRFPTGATDDAADKASQQTDAELALTAAQLQLEEATVSQQEAQADLNDLMTNGKTGSKELADAQKELKQAERDVADATYTHAENQRALTEAQKGVAEHERDIRDAREELTTATQGVATAQDAVTQAIQRTAFAHEAENKLAQDGLVGLQLLRTELESLVKLYPQLQPLLDRVNADLVKNAPFAGLRGYGSSGFQYSKQAQGGIYNRATVGIFGEAGPEAIIPLSPDKSRRRDELLRQAGLMGNSSVRAYANGGIVGSRPSRQTMHNATAGVVSQQFSVSVSIGELHAPTKRDAEVAAGVIVDGITRHFRNGGAMPFWVANSSSR